MRTYVVHRLSPGTVCVRVCMWYSKNENNEKVATTTLNEWLRRKCAWDVVYFKINFQPVILALFLSWISFASILHPACIHFNSWIWADAWFKRVRVSGTLYCGAAEETLIHAGTATCMTLVIWANHGSPSDCFWHTVQIYASTSQYARATSRGLHHSFNFADFICSLSSEWKKKKQDDSLCVMSSFCVQNHFMYYNFTWTWKQSELNNFRCSCSCSCCCCCSIFTLHTQSHLYFSV